MLLSWMPVRPLREIQSGISKGQSLPFRFAIGAAAVLIGFGTPLIAQSPQPPASLEWPVGSAEPVTGGQPVAVPSAVPGALFPGATIPSATIPGATAEPSSSAEPQFGPSSIPPERLVPTLPVAGATAGPDAGASTLPGRRIATQGGGQAAAILNNVAAAGEMIGFSHVDQAGTERITLVHTGKSWMAVYHIDQSGLIRLISSRPIDADFSLQLNATSPRPEEIRQMAGPSR